MKVADYMKANPHKIITARPETGIRDAMALIIDNKISCLPVVNDREELLGIVSEKDIFRQAYRNPEGFSDGQVGAIMTTDLIVGLADDDFEYIAGMMTKNRIRHIPIVENKQLVGLLSVGDIVKSQLSTMEIENRYLKMYIKDTYPG